MSEHPPAFAAEEKVYYKHWFRWQPSKVSYPIQFGKMTKQWIYQLDNGKVKLEDELKRRV